MNIDQLIVLVQIVESGSFRKASEVLHRSQPALTQSIKKLESDLNVSLFSRESYRPALTPAGEIFVKQARRVIGHVQALSVLGKELGLGSEAKLSIALDVICPVTPIVNLMHQALASFAANTELSLLSETLNGGRERILNGEADFAIMPMHSTHPLIEAEPLFTIQKVAVAQPGFFPDNLSLTKEVLHDYTQIILTDSSKKLPKITTASVLQDAKQMHVSDMGVKKEVILQGLGWGTLPRHFIEQELAHKALEMIQIQEGSNELIEIFLLNRRDKPMGPIAKKLKGLILELLREK